MARPGHGGARSGTRSLSISLADPAAHTSPDEVLGMDRDWPGLRVKNTPTSGRDLSGARSRVRYSQIAMNLTPIVPLARLGRHGRQSTLFPRELKSSTRRTNGLAWLA